MCPRVPALPTWCPPSTLGLAVSCCGPVKAPLLQMTPSQDTERSNNPSWGLGAPAQPQWLGERGLQWVRALLSQHSGLAEGSWGHPWGLGRLRTGEISPPPLQPLLSSSWGERADRMAARRSQAGRPGPGGWWGCFQPSLNPESSIQEADPSLMASLGRGSQACCPCRSRGHLSLPSPSPPLMLCWSQHLSKEDQCRQRDFFQSNNEVL